MRHIIVLKNRNGEQAKIAVAVIESDRPTAVKYATRMLPTWRKQFPTAAGFVVKADE